ncbi:hypothetical protein AAAT34_06475, partial [Hallella faecis]
RISLCRTTQRNPNDRFGLNVVFSDMHEETFPGMQRQNYNVFYRRFNAIILPFSRNKNSSKKYSFSYLGWQNPLFFNINK